jgi:hypothetical protein
MVTIVAAMGSDVHTFPPRPVDPALNVDRRRLTGAAAAAGGRDPSGVVGVAAVADCGDLDDAVVLVDEVEDPVRAPACRPQRGQRGFERLADASWGVEECAGDEFVGGCSDLFGQLRRMNSPCSLI